MAKKISYSRQFKDGCYPDQHWDESVRTNGHEVDSPSTARRRQGVARGSQTEANPGMVGKQSYGKKRGK